MGNHQKLWRGYAYLIGTASTAAVVDDGELPPVVTEPAEADGRRGLLPAAGAAVRMPRNRRAAVFV